ncbi:nucleoside-diphosphate-sugar pyrophosphorylase [Clostridium folliculivorans]|uniref:Nucleoside-diphosphate-sugar pyrophosphorylase n=1 Tax=Clostridium folliculivorans TaxID=2886038 RepID=A0A9W5Y5U3_9CLOT|nr:nucleotidyltransferase family protein [Clostridium folliculivorans]GKU27279.1 nucleoside-diphosphate-sugar pyrophosphorylase [Clostridium folliculivorans]
MQGLILAGGLGTRLRSIVSDRPKPMADVNGVPFLTFLIHKLVKASVNNIVLAVGYKSEVIECYFGDGRNLDSSISYSIEKELLGTGGAIANAKKLLVEDEILILNGDTFFDIDLKNMLEFHRGNKSPFTMALRKVDDSSRYGSVEFDSSFKIKNFIEKGVKSNSSYINGGIYIINKEIIMAMKEDIAFSLEKETIPDLLKQDMLYAFLSDDYFIDIGIPEDYIKFCSDVKERKL